MAYTLFPKTTAEIIKNCSKSPDKAGDIVELFSFLKKKFKQVKTPINIDVSKLGVVNVSRELQGMIDIKNIIRDTKISKIKIKFGAGSAGNRGVKNRGNLFENAFANGIRSMWDEEKDSTDFSIKKGVEELAKIHKFSKLKNLIVKEEGAQNVKRPLRFSPGPFITSPTNSLNIGRTVTDLTLHEAKTEQLANPSNVIAFLSLKLGNTTTFFNIGIKKILTRQEIETGRIKNRDGLKLLKMFGIDNKLFCQIFNGTLRKGVIKNTYGDVNKQYLKSFLQSGMGYGFTVVHKLSQGIKVFKIDKNYMEKGTIPLTCKVFYGGKTGTGKRIDMEVETPKYNMKINIRDTQGTDGYPTRIMGDFTYR